MLQTFAGLWTLSRRIDDRLSGIAAEVQGEVDLAPDGVGLTWTETGLMVRADGGRFEVSRRYLWRAGPVGGISVLFEDGRPFHDFDPTAPGDVVAEHDCAPDRYLVRYRFDLPDSWAAEWTVSGPRKDYVSSTDYVRQA